MKLVSTLSAFALVDAIIIILLYFNAEKYCDVPLNMWLVVGLMLSIPSSVGAHYVKKFYGHKAGLVAEVVLLTASFFWMAVGTIDVCRNEINKSLNDRYPCLRHAKPQIQPFGGLYLYPSHYSGAQS
ncbi:uncharacterized protein BXIN_1939 [Babesia sp. Xinjiang]|uniref:uncharacterized protein n=1 Tax=Babesia sp. Xinjiang TaxID=462227 RepID=UPI000A22799F|nr:uncharacterized protein BXIN_1939 [Babesia sp. Xinjiang]ORM40304.1 hypothetical protein BXIN_1939 [Babesia sp. Xinjiang]